MYGWDSSECPLLVLKWQFLLSQMIWIFWLLNYKMIERTQLRNYPVQKGQLGSPGVEIWLQPRLQTSPNLSLCHPRVTSSWGDKRDTCCHPTSWANVSQADNGRVISHIFNYPLGTYRLLIKIKTQDSSRISHCVCLQLIILLLPNCVYEKTSLHSRCLNS